MTFPDWPDDSTVPPILRLARHTAGQVAEMSGVEEYADLELAAVTIWGLISGHTRGRAIPLGGPAPSDLMAVARTATARLHASPAQWSMQSDTAADGSASRREGGFQGFTIAELMVINRYRVRMA